MLEKFLEKYDSGDLKFNNLPYRKGALITCDFGLSEGYRKVNGKLVFDTVRIHSGVDRSGTRGKPGKSFYNVVVSPFDFNRTEYNDYGNDHVYGSMTRLFNDDYGFEMRIVHLQPEEIESSVLAKFKKKEGITHRTIIGQAGDYGSASSGRHTHTEFVSMYEVCPIFEDILEHKFREDAFLPFINSEITDFYHTKSFWVNAEKQDILDNFDSLLVKRKIKNRECNNFKYVYQDWYYGYKGYQTRYSSEKLFNGL